MIYTSAYVSTLVQPLSAYDVAELLDLSRANNAERGISGMLLLRGRNVMQLLEGEQAQVRGLLARIAADPRHTGVTTVWSSTHEQRRFPEWTMGFDDLAAGSAPRAATWGEPHLDALGVPGAPGDPGDLADVGVVAGDADPLVGGYVQRRAEVLRRALVSGDRLTTALGIVLHGHRPEVVLRSGTPALHCAECREFGDPELDSYPCSTAKNVIWALESVHR